VSSFSARSAFSAACRKLSSAGTVNSSNRFVDRQRAVNLHMCWDSLILIQHKRGARNVDYSDKLNARITQKQVAKWSQGSPET
jgi:hypothetical protein